MCIFLHMQRHSLSHLRLAYSACNENKSSDSIICCINLSTTYNMMSKTMAVCERWTLFGGLIILLYSVDQSIQTSLDEWFKKYFGKWYIIKMLGLVFLQILKREEAQNEFIIKYCILGVKGLNWVMVHPLQTCLSNVDFFLFQSNCCIL